MRKTIFSFLSILTLLLVLRTVTTGRSGSVIRYDEINSRYTILGPLGRELGSVLVLEVEKVQTGEKSDPPVLEVRSVNGKSLAKPVRLRYRMLIARDRFEAGKQYKIKAYQDGSFQGTPAGVLKDILFQTSEYRFGVTLVVYQYLK